MEFSPAMKERLAKGFAWIEANKNHSVEEFTKQLSELADQYNSEIADLSEDQFNFKPSEKEWSIREVSLHVSNSIGGTGQMIKILTGGTTLPDDVPPSILDKDPGDQTKIKEKVAKAFDHALKTLPCLDGSEDLEATFKHPFFGPINCRQTAAFNIMHLNIHVKQIQRVKGYDSYPS